MTEENTQQQYRAALARQQNQRSAMRGKRSQTSLTSGIARKAGKKFLFWVIGSLLGLFGTSMIFALVIGVLMLVLMVPVLQFLDLV